MYRKIISAVDGSFHSDLASRYATAIASSRGCELIVLAVDNGEVEREELSGAVEHICDRAKKMGVPVKDMIREGETVRTILDTVRSEKADLLVVATRRGEHRLFVRSITQKLMVRSPSSVIAVKPAGFAMKGRSILLPVAHRELAHDERVALTAGLAKFYEHHVEILHVVERQQWYNLSPEKLQKMREHAQENMTPVAVKLKEQGIEVDLRVVISESSINSILKESAIGKHSLVLLGASRKGILKKVVSNNIIEEMLSRLLCDVMIWRPKP